MPVYLDPVDGLVLDPAARQAETSQLLTALATPDDIAGDVAEILAASDRCGIASHGMARPNYVPLFEAGVLRRNADHE